ncbi:MAG: hypothetical protein P0Y53_05160 [Candidatus Pseudobacter hemicellulosilyticus]|uniref:Uncharacterized protein n=1 Tax=Candidatus Pseudobacter hemicellulosilyticus TaxID=3121375 RepID=A0AAJ5WYW9_9BACT|nr:MAG: hypothetical protein P0Y53_05160 [Pseudobacter sp.]
MEKILSRLALISFLGCLTLVALAAGDASKTKAKDRSKNSCRYSFDQPVTAAEKMGEMFLPGRLIERFIQ